MDREYESKILPNGKKYSELRIFIRALFSLGLFMSNL